LKRIIVCEDHSIVYEGLELLLSNNLKYQIIGHATHGLILEELLEESNPDILILDINLPDIDGLTLLKKIRDYNKRIKIMIFTMYDDFSLIEKARDFGADAYLIKNATNEELLSALDGLSKPEFYVLPSVQKEIDNKKTYRDRFVQKLKLTSREIQIIQNLARGHSNQEVADLLFISLYTVETHRKNIFRKLELSGLGNLIRFAHDNGLV
jgi:DNA-binding NarL/FixJ family response regulator